MESEEVSVCSHVTEAKVIRAMFMKNLETE